MKRMRGRKGGANSRKTGKKIAESHKSRKTNPNRHKGQGSEQRGGEKKKRIVKPKNNRTPSPTSMTRGEYLSRMEMVEKGRVKMKKVAKPEKKVEKKNGEDEEM